ncbi:MAG: DUF4838 domain-containing protein [Kiritimatiellia bacterium]|nr:DUF4838 domain-containing protein [Kiritimatiellia bacterium]
MFTQRKLMAAVVSIMSVIGVLASSGNAAPKVQVKYSNDGITIAERGKAKSIIVLGKDAIAPEKTAAKELAEYLKKVTGAEFKIIGEGEETQKDNLIYVGPTKYALENGLDSDLLAEEQWFVRTVNGNLILTGGRPRGTLYAVYHFLEDVVGAHWWSPWEEFVPDRKKLATGKLNLYGEPVFKIRKLDSSRHGYYELGSHHLFCVRNRINSPHGGNIPSEYGGGCKYGPPSLVHTEGHYFVTFKKRGDFKTHPEWLALKNGKREIHERWTANQLCLSNKELREAFLKELKENIKKTRGQDVPPMIFDVSLNDVSSVCQCADCAAIVQKYGNSDTGLLLDFVNYMADGVKKDYPDVLIETLAYLNTEQVPGGILPCYNVMITLCDTKSTYAAPIPKDGYFAKRLEAWAKVTNKINIWDYHSNFADLALPMPFESTFQPDLQLFRKYNAIGYFTEFHYPIFEDMRDLRLWLLTRLCEDPYQDQNELIKTFTDGFYGPAGGFIREYLKTLQDAAREAPSIVYTSGKTESCKYLTPDFVAGVQKIFDRAEEAVRNSEILLRRVRHARIAIDKATLAVFPQIWQQQVKQGKKAEDIPLNRDKIAARIKDTVEQQWQLRVDIKKIAITNTTSKWRRGEMEKQKKEFLDKIDQYLKKKLIEINPPAKFAHLPEGGYTDYPADRFVIYNNENTRVLDDDKESETGIINRTELSGKDLEKFKDYVLKWDRHDYTKPAKGDEPTIRYLKQGDIPGEGYHWYKLGTYQLTENNFLWIYDVDLEINLRGARDPLDTAAEYDLWARIKFEGPAFPHGKKEQKNAVCIERITAVKAEKKQQ